jgi:chromosome condensin MukBEF ATPase and DNA-binding subunit MukB
MSDDEVFWLADVVTILHSNGTVQHAEHVQRAIGTIAQLRADLARVTAERDRMREALNGAFAAVSASYDEAQAEWQRQDKRGEKANKIVREWRELARAALASEGGR